MRSTVTNLGSRSRTARVGNPAVGRAGALSHQLEHGAVIEPVRVLVGGQNAERLSGGGHDHERGRLLPREGIAHARGGGTTVPPIAGPRAGGQVDAGAALGRPIASRLTVPRRSWSTTVAPCSGLKVIERRAVRSGTLVPGVRSYRVSTARSTIFISSSAKLARLRVGKHGLDPEDLVDGRRQVFLAVALKLVRQPCERRRLAREPLGPPRQLRDGRLSSPNTARRMISSVTR